MHMMHLFLPGIRNMDIFGRITERISKDKEMKS